jgi:HEAT repeat protein
MLTTPLLALSLTLAAAGSSYNGPGETFAHWLTRHGIPLTHDGLIAALNNPDGDIRVNTAAQLALNNDKDAIPSIRDAAARDPKFVNRSNMAFYLAQLGDPSGADFLKAACSDTSLPAYDRLHAANNMLTLHSDACFPVVLSILQSSGDEEAIDQALELCAGAKYQLGGDGSQTSPPDKKRNELVIELVGKRLGDDAPFTRLVASSVLSRLGDSSQAHFLQDTISRETDEWNRVRMQRDLENLLAKPPAQ